MKEEFFGICISFYGAQRTALFSARVNSQCAYERETLQTTANISINLEQMDNVLILCAMDLDN